MKNFQRAGLACSVSVIAALCLIAPASAATQMQIADGGSIERLSSTVPVEVNVDMDSPAAAVSIISAPAAAKLSFSRPAVKTIAAPPPPPPAPKAEVAPQAEAAVAAPSTPAPAAVVAPTRRGAAAAAQYAPAAAPAVAVAPAVAHAAPVASASGKGALVAAAAMAQLGVGQDCTALVSNALSAAGINFHSAPAGYMSLGSVVSAAQAQPGDLIYYANAGAGMPHIAVYIGGGKAVHGGWNGGTTAVYSAYLGSGPTFIHLR